MQFCDCSPRLIRVDYQPHIACVRLLKSCRSDIIYIRGGGTRQDAESLCGLLAGYINSPHVAGATVLSLGCQHAQVSLLESELARRNAHFKKPLHIFEQQKSASERDMMQRAIKASGAERVIVTHGYEAVMVRWLGEQGLPAQSFTTEYGDDAAEAVHEVAS